MIKPVVRDVILLARKSAEATEEDADVGRDLTDTLTANSKRCVGMAANMIGIPKRIIVVNAGGSVLLMYNPVILKKEGRYETEEGCLSLDGVRKTVRFRTVEVEYRDGSWKKRKQRFSGRTAQIVQHEMDHLEGILI